MSTINSKKESDLLRLYNIAFANTEANPAIGIALSSSGYNAEKLANGKKLLKEAEDLYKVSLVEKEKLAAAYEVFSLRRASLEKAFRLHRRMTKIAFRGQKLTLEKLAISRIVYKDYGSWIKCATKFYSEMAANPEFHQKLTSFGVTEEDIQKGHQMVEEVLSAYTIYVNLKGESQKTTAKKRVAFHKISEWMRDFYAIAKIAFNDHPQQIESFGIVVKN